jgi:hypothetical protein
LNSRKTLIVKLLLMKLSLIFSAILIGLCATSCAPLGRLTIKELAGVSAKATAQVSAIATDLPESCVRMNEYRIIRTGDYDPETLHQKADSSCAGYQKTKQTVMVSASILTGYLDALTNLAAGKGVKFDSTLTKLAGSVQTLGVPANQTSAIGGLAKLVANAASAGWREKQLRQAIETANADVQVLTKTLADVVNQDAGGSYQQNLLNEEEAAKKLYLATIKENRNHDPLMILLVHQQWKRDYYVIQDRKQAAAACQALLAKIGAAHQTLYDNRNSLKGKDLQTDLGPAITQILSLQEQIKKAF